MIIRYILHHKLRRAHFFTIIGVTLLIYTNLTRSAPTILKNDFGSKGRSVSDLKVPLVLVTKYRRKAFTKLMLTPLQVVME
jgi:putative transposase